MEGDLERLANSIDIGSAFGSLEFCIRGTGQCDCWRRDVEWINEGRGGGRGQLTYCHSSE